MHQHRRRRSDVEDVGVTSRKSGWRRVVLDVTPTCSTSPRRARRQPQPLARAQTADEAAMEVTEIEESS